ncbi:hypothetical protein [Phenylobacterium sp.]|uniref:hypothetical protein n=1 Tax=Phenylobacterium sp. TaxID=1871053 RepID=UPI00121FA1D4|nr:hypothetical protein [Phenylobacterium sp.]THD59277.1 MAG: hypothetical protein E8A49_16845 [Phenylobacterium sp.]
MSRPFGKLAWGGTAAVLSPDDWTAPVGLAVLLGRVGGAFLVVARCVAMTKTSLLILAALLTAPIGAQAAAEPSAAVSAAFGNTILTIDPDGRSRKIWLQPDGSWTGLSRRGLDLAGKWKMEGDKVCLSQSKPRLPGSMCQVFPTDPKVGVDAKDPTGKVVHLKLVKGHVEK